MTNDGTPQLARALTLRDLVLWSAVTCHRFESPRLVAAAAAGRLIAASEKRRLIAAVQKLAQTRDGHEFREASWSALPMDRERFGKPV